VGDFDGSGHAGWASTCHGAPTEHLFTPASRSPRGDGFRGRHPPQVLRQGPLSSLVHVRSANGHSDAVDSTTATAGGRPGGGTASPQDRPGVIATNIMDGARPTSTSRKMCTSDKTAGSAYGYRATIPTRAGLRGDPGLMTWGLSARRQGVGSAFYLQIPVEQPRGQVTDVVAVVVRPCRGRPDLSPRQEGPRGIEH